MSAGQQLLGLALPERDGRIVAHDPLAVGGVQMDRHAAERPAPLDHGRVVVRMRDRDALDAAHGLDQLDGGAIDQRDAVPQDIAVRGAQKLRALADAERRQGDDRRSGPARARASAFCSAWRSASSVVQLWPAGVTYCRSSSQIGQFAGGLSLGAYCVPQVVQMKAGMGDLARSIGR